MESIKKELTHLYMTDEQYLSILQRLRDQIASGIELIAEDSNTTGNKYTYCSWGLCTQSPNFWGKDEILFSNDPLHSKYFLDTHVCPLDTRKKENKAGIGCFYECLVFQRKEKFHTRSIVLELYDKIIKKLDKR